METYHHHPVIMSDQIPEMAFLPQQTPSDNTNYQLQHHTMIPPSSVKHETFQMGYVGSFEDAPMSDESSSYSCSSMASQSLSPSIHNPHPELFDLHVANLFPGNGGEQTSPTAYGESRRGSEDDSIRAERRRAQNRAAQRAYRQRKDQSLKQREREIEVLHEQLDKAQRQNQTLCKVVSMLRERLKETSPPPTANPP